MNGLIKTNTNKNKFSGGQSGNAVILALMVCVMVAMMASTVPSLIGASEKQMRVSRIKSVMTNLENRIRRIVMDPSTYLCPTNVSGYTTPSSCPLDLAKLNDLRSLRIPGPQQCTGPACINPQINFNFDLPGNTLISTGTSFEFQGTISYNNVDVNIQPINLRIQVPVDVVNIKTINCGALYSGLRPIFGGLNSDGSPICRTIGNNCGAGKYLSAVSPTDLSYTCESMDTSTLSCGAGQMLSNLNWSSGTYSGNCIPVPNNPFNLSVAFPYNPNICVGPNPCAPPAPPVNCAGTWGACVAPGFQTFTITTPASGGGAACPSPLTRACVMPPPGPVPPTADAGCGPSANSVAYVAPTSGFCTAGSNLLTPPGVTYDLVNNQWFEWQCNGTDGNIPCNTLHQNLPYNGDCDPNAIIGTHMVVPTNLCAAGYALPATPTLVPVPPPPATPTHQEWQWQCMGMSGGTNASCAAVKTSNDNGACLATAPAPSTTPPDGVGCQAGTQSAVTVPTAAPWDYSWTCGTAPGTVVTCTSPMMIDGVCGSDNGQSLTATPTNLCTVGTASSVNGNGPWNWTCQGENGGASPNCNAISSVTTTTLPYVRQYTNTSSVNPTGLFITTFDDFRHGPDSMCQLLGYSSAYINPSTGTNNFNCVAINHSLMNCYDVYDGGGYYQRTDCTPNTSLLNLSCKHNGGWQRLSDNPMVFNCYGQDWCTGYSYIEWIDCIP